VASAAEVQNVPRRLQHIQELSGVHLLRLHGSPDECGGPRRGGMGSAVRALSQTRDLHLRARKDARPGSSIFRSGAEDREPFRSRSTQEIPIGAGEEDIQPLFPQEQSAREMDGVGAPERDGARRPGDEFEHRRSGLHLADLLPIVREVEPELLELGVK